MSDMIVYLLRLHVIDYYTPVPATPAATWTHRLEMKLQGMAEVKIDREYKAAGTQTSDGKTYDAIQWTGNLTVSPLKDDEGVMPFKITEMKLTGDPKDAGTILWDRSAGRPALVTTEQFTGLQMKMDIKDKSFEGSVKVTDTFTFKSLDKFDEPK
jgi:hypothetical protein